LGQVRSTAPAQRLVRFEEQFDAVVYLGEPGEMTMAKMGRARCDDAKYIWRPCVSPKYSSSTRRNNRLPHSVPLSE
jgi:hypothetical protein